MPQEVKAAPLAIHFMPWANINTNFKIGPVTFWPYFMEAGDRIQDQATRTHLDEYFKSYVDGRGKPVSSVAVVSHENTADFRQLTPTEIGEVESACNSLVFSVIYPNNVRGVINNNDSDGPPSADRYKLIKQMCTPGRDHIAVACRSGMNAGWQIGEVQFSKPWCLG